MNMQNKYEEIMHFNYEFYSKAEVSKKRSPYFNKR